jgi:hypothetical protein
MIVQAAFIAALAGSHAAAQTTNYVSKGNLESKNDLACAGGLSNKYTPADLFKGVARCITSEDYERTLLPHMLAFAYGLYDQARVADESAHEAIPALNMELSQSLDPAKLTKYNELRTAFAHDKRRQKAACARLRRIGKPDYFPTYMIQHGMGAFTGTKGDDGIVPGFNGKTAWEKVLTVSMHCESARPESTRP